MDNSAVYFIHISVEDMWKGFYLWKTFISLLSIKSIVLYSKNFFYRSSKDKTPKALLYKGKTVKRSFSDLQHIDGLPQDLIHI